MHGANRLASNSLLEGLVFAERVARDLPYVKILGRAPAAAKWKVPPLPDRGAAQVAADAIRAVMWEDAGIARTARGLRDSARATRLRSARGCPPARRRSSTCCRRRSSSSRRR